MKRGERNWEKTDKMQWGLMGEKTTREDQKMGVQKKRSRRRGGVLDGEKLHRNQAKKSKKKGGGSEGADWLRRKGVERWKGEWPSPPKTHRQKGQV